MRIDNLTIAYGERLVFNDFSFEFSDQTITAILGPSGIGKTTLLNALTFAHSTVSRIYQEPRLLPWYTLEKNISIVLEGSRESRLLRARKYLDKVGLSEKYNAFPCQISGGECQRASIARAFAYPAKTLLMDEPFQGQDIASKARLIDLIRTLQKEENRTIVAVTHDIQDAIILAKRIVVLSGNPARIQLDIEVTSDAKARVEEALSSL